MRWQIGNGRLVHVWEDDWGPTTLHQCPNPREVQWVADLIDADSGSWDVSILREVFDEDSVQRVQQAALTDCRRRDYVVWTFDPQGLFSVKSAYRVAVCSESHHQAVGSLEKTQNQRMWKTVWKLKIPNKVKCHLWRACLNALPTRFSLCRRRIIQDPCYLICNSASETTTHTLWACPYVVSGHLVQEDSKNYRPQRLIFSCYLGNFSRTCRASWVKSGLSRAGLSGTLKINSSMRKC